MRSARRTSRLVITVTALAIGLALPATAAAGGFSAHLYAHGHEPKVGMWPITITANRGRQKLSGSVYYRFFWHGQLVNRYQSGGHFRHGVYHDKLKWPAKAVGHTITLQVVVHTRYGTDYLNWWIRVRR